MSDFKGKLNNVVKDSDLGSDQKLLWDLFLKFSSTEEDEAVFEAVTESTENLEYLTLYLKDKVSDMKDKNTDAWQKLIGKEAQYAGLLG